MAHIRKLKNGKYQVRYRDPSGREHAKNFERKMDAERYLTSVEAEKLQGSWVDPRLGRITFGEWAAVSEATLGNRRPTTLARDEASLRNHVLPFFRTMKLHAVRPSDVRRWMGEMESKGLAASTIRKAYQIVARTFAAAVDDGRLAQSPCRSIRLPRIERAQPRFLSAAEVVNLGDATDPRYSTLVLAGAYTGLRFGELATLRVQRVDLLRRTLRVQETLVEVGGHLSFGPPKTRASRRSVVVPRFLAERISLQIERFPDPTDLVFTSPEGGPLRRTNFRRRVWRPAVEASIGQPCTFHDLRHTHAALLISEGCHPKVIQERMGHGSIRVTLDTYGHLFDGLDEAAADSLDAVFGSATASGPHGGFGLAQRDGSSAVRVRDIAQRGR